MTDEWHDLLHLLGYSPKWLEYGMVSKVLLRKQTDLFTISDDKNTEHYRYRAFRAVLAEHAALSDEKVVQYIRLAGLDENISMACSVLADLVQWPGLTEEQFKWLSAHADYDVPFLQKVISRKRLLDKLRRGPLTDLLLEECLASGNAVIQRLMLEASSMSRSQVGLLEERGASRAVRNMAKTRLRRKDGLLMQCIKNGYQRVH